MKIKRSICFIITFMMLIFFGLCNITVLADEESNGKIILLDPGHGGRDGGAKSKNGIEEKNINLAISKKIRDNLAQKGYKVFLTREDDVDLKSENVKSSSFKVKDLSRRCELKRETNCDMFISIHLNKYSDSKPKGAQVWYSSYEKSKILADMLQAGFKKDIDEENHRVAKPAGTQFKILRDKYECPSVIVECGFLSNPVEEELLQTDDYQNKLAQSIANSIESYYEKEKN